MDREMKFRALLTEVDDYLSDRDQKRLRFVLGNVITKRLRDHPTVTDTVSVWETLFERGKISCDDFRFLIETFDGIGCDRAAQRLRDYATECGKPEMIPPSQPINYLARFEDDGAVGLAGHDKIVDKAGATCLLIPPSTPPAKSHKKPWLKRKQLLSRMTLLGLITLIVLIVLIVFFILFLHQASRPPPPRSSPPVSNKNDPLEPVKTDRVIQAYFTAWSVYRSFNISTINANKLTHITYAFAAISSGGTVEIQDSNVDHKNFKQLIKLKKHYPHLRTIISVGGYLGSTLFSDVAANEQNRTKFAKSCVEFLEEHKLDGIEVNWLHPVKGAQPDPKYRPEDKTNFSLLLKEIRQHLNNVKDKQYTLTITGGVATDIVNLDLPEINRYVDWIVVLAYHYHGTWDPRTNHVAALHANEDEKQSPFTANLNCDSSIHEYIKGGVPHDKLVMGIHLSGIGWQGLKTTDRNGYRQITSITPPKGTFPGELGVFTYDHLKKDFIPTYEYFFDTEAQVPYLFNISTRIWISYENERSISSKAYYVNVLRLRGVCFWDLETDQNAELIGLGSDILTRHPYSLNSSLNK